MNNSQLPEGYKLTDVGIFPEQWEVMSLATMCKAILDCHHSTPVWTETGTIVIRNQNIRDGSLDFSEPSFTDQRHFAERTRRAVPSFGDLVITREAPMGQVCMIPNGLKCCLGQRMVLLRIDCDSADVAYLLYAIQSDLLQRSIFVAGGTGSTVSNLRIPSLKSLQIPTPPLPEQRSIATALSDMDELLGGLDRLIAKKRDLKQSTMQQLLTGKTRLLGFCEGKSYKKTEVGLIPEDWDSVEMKNIVESNRIPSGIYKEKSLYGDGSQIIKLGDIFNLDYFDPNQSQRVLLESDEISKYRVNIGDIFIALASVKLEGVGKVMLVTELNEDTAYDHNVALIRVNNLVDPKFIFYVLKSDFVRNEVSKAATQVGTTFLKASTILAFQLPIPPLPEQTTIASVLSDMDTEITTIEQRRNKTRDLKQAMMQELLTGRIRLV